MSKMWQNINHFIKHKDNLRCIGFYFLIVMVFFGTFLKLDFATDTYAEIMASREHITENFLRGGRFITVFFYLAFRFLHINVQIANLLSFLLAIISLTAALTILSKLILKTITKDKRLAFILPLLILLNPFIIELFFFIEKGIMIFSILLCVISVWYYNEYLESRSKKDLIKIIILNLFATACYQGTIGIFIVLATVITLIKSQDFRNFIKNTVLSVGLYAIGPILNLVLIKLTSTGGRTSESLNLKESLSVILTDVDKMLKIFNIVPSICFWGGIGLIMLAWVIYALSNKNKQCLQNFTLNLVRICYIAAVTLMAALVPQMIQKPSSVWIASRSTYVFASLFGIITLLVIYFYPKFVAVRPWKYITPTITISFLAIQLVYFNNAIVDHYAIAEIDRLRAEEINRVITNYEREHNTTIKFVAPSKDQNHTYSYPGIFVLRDSNISAFNTDWSDVASLGFWNHRRFIRRDPSPKWQEYCMQHDWQGLDPKQYRFTDDTLEICWY